MVELLRRAGAADIPVFGGGGGTITDKEIALLHERGVARLYSVEDGRRMGLVGMIRDMMDARAPRPHLGFRRPLRGLSARATRPRSRG
jgi:methylmalonyl-CoA mutase cobalamin-binding subunit